MIPVQQTILNSVNGDCLRACIASILDLPIEAVPNFMDEPGDGWRDAFSKFLAQFDLQALDFPTAELANWSPSGYHLLAGKGPRGVYHSVVGYQGIVVWDPYPEGTGLETVEFVTVFVSGMNCLPATNPTEISVPSGKL